MTIVSPALVAALRAAGTVVGNLLGRSAGVLLLAMLPLFPAAAQTGPAQAPAPAAGTPEAARAAEQRALMKTDRFRHLASELRCLVCQNQSLEDSNAPLAQDLREEVARLMAGGRDDRQIKDYLVARYGEFVLYRPSVSARNAVLWFGPFLLLILGAVAWWRLGRSKPVRPQSAQDALQHVDELLGR